MTEIQELLDLANEIKKIWPLSHKWRRNNGNIEFSIPLYEEESWFPYWQTPEKVERYIRAWIKLNEIS